MEELKSCCYNRNSPKFESTRTSALPSINMMSFASIVTTRNVFLQHEITLFYRTKRTHIHYWYCKLFPMCTCSQFLRQSACISAKICMRHNDFVVTWFLGLPLISHPPDWETLFRKSEGSKSSGFK